MRTLTVLGSTGSIGVSTLDVVRRHPEKFRIAALCAHSQQDRLFEQCLEFKPCYAVLGKRESAVELQERLRQAGSLTKVEYGEVALEKMASLPEADTVMAAIVGAAGLLPALAAARAGKRILLANKEALVMAGAVFMRAVKEYGAELHPIDSEHNAVFQSLPINYSGDFLGSGVERILLTASGGPFRNACPDDLHAVTPDQACAHPKWSMGRKISVDSATMMNKGLEVIEAHWLFNIPGERIDVVIHPESVIHSLVQYVDGSVIAELGNPDMRTPIAHALAYPERIDSGVGPLDLFAVGQLNFTRPDADLFPCLALAYQALYLGGSASAVLNAANEVAVQAFLDGQLSFTSIAKVNRMVLDSAPILPINTIDDVLQADSLARQAAFDLVSERRIQ